MESSEWCVFLQRVSLRRLDRVPRTRKFQAFYGAYFYGAYFYGVMGSAGRIRVLVGYDVREPDVLRSQD